ncbi:bis(5'-adenosyl)-triphosphatase enpp4 [Osmerus mordax]|uniref:bis(5'-adenosyl)-triphosphatase enpp4 n=1 Tax=Osmerus mordax TaxID=8014 RepID=UPI0035101ED9
MLLWFLLGFLCGCSSLAAVPQTGTDVNSTTPPPVLLVSFDGFRADYLKRFSLPNLEKLYSQGVLVEQLTNVFTTKTFPNHYSLVTGLYAESHGILASSMYDPATHKKFSPSQDSDPFWWNQAEPIWLHALDYGLSTAAMMWPGCDVHIRNRTATHFQNYTSTMTFQQRLGLVVKWLLGDEKEKGVSFAALYWEEPDGTGHKYGPDNTTAMAHALKQVDENVGLLMSELNSTGLWGRINLIVTSDHGMAQCSPERIIRLNSCLHPDNYTLVDLTPVAALIPTADTGVVFSLLKKCHPHMTAYRKEAIPDKLHYRNNKHIQPIILVADEGWTIVQQGELPRLGDHGYDNTLPSMHPFLAAVGPGFRSGYSLPMLQSVDVYPLVCHLLSIPPGPNNGSLAQARCLLAGESCSSLIMVIGIVVGVLLLLTTLTGLFRFIKPRPSASRPFQRIQLDDDDDDDDDPLLG